MATKASLRGLVEIASHEGIVNYPYFDSKGVRTLGIGHTASAGAPDPSKNLRVFSTQEIMDIFARDIGSFEKRVNAAFKRPLTQSQFDAALSFDFNTGGIHRASWVRHFNAGNMAAAKKAFMNWRKPPEIIDRRAAERDLFFNGTYSSGGYARLYPATSTGTVLWSRGQLVNVDALLRQESATSTREAPPTPKTPETPKRPPAAKPDGFWARLFSAIAALIERIRS